MMDSAAINFSRRLINSSHTLATQKTYMNPSRKLFSSILCQYVVGDILNDQIGPISSQNHSTKRCELRSGKQRLAVEACPVLSMVNVTPPPHCQYNHNVYDEQEINFGFLLLQRGMAPSLRVYVDDRKGEREPLLRKALD